jgi:hypothetical protein
LNKAQWFKRSSFKSNCEQRRRREIFVACAINFSLAPSGAAYFPMSLLRSLGMFAANNYKDAAPMALKKTGGDNP